MRGVARVARGARLTEARRRLQAAHFRQQREDRNGGHAHVLGVDALDEDDAVSYGALKARIDYGSEEGGKMSSSPEAQLGVMEAMDRYILDTFTNYFQKKTWYFNCSK